MTDASLRLLRAARALVAAGWCQGVWARDADGNGVMPFDHRAVAWCLSGALAAAAPPVFGPAWMDALDRVYQVLPKCVTTISYNDVPGRTQADILALLDAAITHE